MKLFSKKYVNNKLIIKIFGIKLSFKSETNTGFITIYQNATLRKTKDSKRILIHTYSMGFLLTQLAVAKKLYGDCIIDIFLSSFSEESTQNILNLIKTIPNINKLTLITSEYANNLESFQNRKNYLKKLKNIFYNDFGIKKYDSVIYVFDINDSLIGILKAIFPDAQFVITGDAVGFYYEKEAQKKFYGHEINYNNIFEFIEPDVFMNILPIQIYKRDFTSKTEIKVLSKEDYINNFKSLTGMYEELADYFQRLLTKYQDKTKCLLLAENYAQCGFTTEEKEINLYCDAIKKNFPKNSVVFIKQHPFDKELSLDKYKSVLGYDWELVNIDKNFIFYPVEIMQDLIKNGDFIMSAGIPRVSVKYLYDKDVICPFNGANIADYFEGKYQDIIAYNIKVVEEPLKALKNWDSKSILCKGIA